MRGRLAGAEALLWRPWVVAAVVALLVGLPILLLGELSANDTRDRLRAQRYAANGALAERAADLVASRILALEAVAPAYSDG